MYPRLAQNVFMQYKQMQHTFTWLKKYSATKANGTHLSIVIIISHNTRQLAGTEGRAEARPRMLWEPPFPSSVQLIHLSVCLSSSLPALYSQLILIFKSLALPMGRRSHLCPRDLARTVTLLMPHMCAQPHPHLSSWSPFSFDDQEFFVRTYLLFTSSALIESEFLAPIAIDR